MPKILTDEELGMIIFNATHNSEILDDADSYEHFLEDLSELICRYFGGDCGRVGRPDHDLGWTVGFYVDENVPSDGGVFKDYDTGVTWRDGEETQA